MTNLSRRQALGGVATVGLGVPLLAACGSGGSDAADVQSGAELAKTSDVPVGGGLVLSDQQLIITQPKAGTFKAFSNICTHRQCPITTIQGDEMVCGCHGSQFSISDGRNTVGPGGEPAGSTANLATVDIKVAGTSIVKL